MDIPTFRSKVSAELDGITYDKLAACCCNFNKSPRNSKIVLEPDRVVVMGMLGHEYKYSDFEDKNEAILSAMMGVMFLGGFA